MKFRKLNANEIDARVATISEKGCSLLLYKDARVDQNILDETVGPENWQRSHQVIDGKLCCTISIWDDNKGQWISKQDVGTESFTEKEKGQFSDSFKRSAVNVGIGRELYTAPFIWISGHTKEHNGRYKTDGYDRKLTLTDIAYDDSRRISRLVIKDNDSKVVFNYKQGEFTLSTEEQKTETSEKDRPRLVAQIGELLEQKNLNPEEVYKKVGVSNLSEIATERLPGMVEWLERM
jgi:hypothetical protein